MSALLFFSQADAQITSLPVPTKLTIHHRITWFQGGGALSFQHEISSAQITIPEPYDRSFTSVTLHLRGINSPSLLEKRSSILVSVNGNPASTLSLDGSQPEINQTITIPGKFFTPGYNVVTLRVVQTTGQICEKFDEPSLWTRLSPLSTVTIVSVPRPITRNLADLGRIFDKHSLQKDARVTILYNAVARQHPDIIVAAAQGIARLYDYVPVKIDVVPLTGQQSDIADPPSRPVIVLAPSPSSTNPKNSTNAKIAIKPTANGGTLIRISGTWQSVMVAARLLGTRQFSWPDANSATISTASYLNHQKTAPSDNLDQSLLDLHTLTSTLVGPNVEFGPITFWNDYWGGRALITAHLVYGAGGAPDNLLGVYVNGIFVGNVPLNRSIGGVYTDYKIAVPAHVLVPGKNELVFRGTLRHQPVHGGECTSAGYSKGIPITLFDDSTVRIAGGSRLIPDNLAELNYAQILPHQLLLAGNSPSVLSAAATLAAKITQTDSGITLRAQMLKPGVPIEGAVIIGKLASIPTSIIGKTGIVPGASAPASSHRVVYINNATDRPSRGMSGSIPPTGPVVAVSSKHDATYVAMIPSGKLGTIVVAAQTGPSLKSGVDTLIGWSHWSQLGGHVAVIEPGAKTLAIAPANLKVESVAGRIGYFATRNIIIALLGFLALLVVTVLVVRKALNRRYAERNSSGKKPGGAL
ncbi:cellulose synthase operon protein B [Acidiphilium sp. MT5]